jgi:hypothetical protein
MHLRTLRLVYCSLLAFVACPTSTPAQVVRVNLHLQMGGTDRNYPGCNGTMFAHAGAAVELGHPLLVEFLGEVMSAGSLDQCLPVAPPTEPGGESGDLIINDPNWRVGVGVGRRLVGERFTLIARAGSFPDTREVFFSGDGRVNFLVFTAGFELGKVRARWEFDNGAHYRKWSTFGGVSIGLRI